MKVQLVCCNHRVGGVKTLAHFFQFWLYWVDIVLKTSQNKNQLWARLQEQCDVFVVGVGRVEAERAGELWKRRKDTGEEENHGSSARCRQQPGPASGRMTEMIRTSSMLDWVDACWLCVTAARGGDQREASGTAGVSVGEAPHATHRRTPQTERNVQPPRRESCCRSVTHDRLLFQ